MSIIVVNARFLTQSITGVQRYAVEVCLELKKKSPTIKFVAPNNIIHHDIARELKAQTFGVSKGHLWEQIELPLYLIRKGKPLLLNLGNTAPLFYKNKVVTLYDLAFYHYPEWFSSVFSTYYRFLIPKILQSSKHVITDSEFIKNEIVEVYRVLPDDISVVYGAPASIFFSADSSRASNSPYILAVGSLDPRKNLVTLIKSFNSLELKGIRLIIVGQKNRVFSDESVEKLANENPFIEFTGYVTDDNLVKLYREAALFVYPTLYEGFGFPPLEAQACGCPLIASCVASLPEVCGDSALYCDPYNISDIADKLSMVLGDKLLQEKLRQKGFMNIKKFSWHISANAILKIVNRFE